VGRHDFVLPDREDNDDSSGETSSAHAAASRDANFAYAGSSSEIEAARTTNLLSASYKLRFNCIL